MFYDSGWICAGNKTEKTEEEKKRHSSYDIQYVNCLFLKGWNDPRKCYKETKMKPQRQH